MFCVIYRSTKREQTYLYVEKKDDFSRVPDELMYSFGKPKVKQALADQGYYLQLPPPSENLLKKHLAEQGNKSD